MVVDTKAPENARKTYEEARAELSEVSDEELVTRHLEGDPHAFQVLMDRYRGRLIRFINRTVGDRDRSEDLVQETFLRVYRHLHRFDTTRKFSTWIYTIAGNLAKNELRNRSRNPLILFQTITKNREEDDRPLQWEDISYAPDDLARKRNLQETVEKAVTELPDHHREVFELREMQGKSYEEIAEITGVKLGTVKSRLNRARNKFAEIISRKMEGGSASSNGSNGANGANGSNGSAGSRGRGGEVS